MFYSQEILTSPRNGVATVWLAATVGHRPGARKIARKDAMDVNIPKACLTITHPVAPMALRLQGHLLYGVSRVFHQQCIYMLGDAEKVQAHMQNFLRARGRNTNDLQADKATTRPRQLIVPDDPAFELEFRLPGFDSDQPKPFLGLSQVSQDSRKSSSQLSPADRYTSSILSMIGDLSLPGSLPHTLQLRMPFGRDSAASQQLGEGPVGGIEEEETVPAFDDWGIEVDADGNVVAEANPAKPSRFPRAPTEREKIQPQQANYKSNEDGAVVVDLGEAEFLPDAEAFPLRRADQQAQSDDPSPVLVAPMRRGRKLRQPALIKPDKETKISKPEFRAWNASYVARQEAARSKTVTTTSRAQAQENAWNLIIGRGIMGVGLPADILGNSYPLAQQFAGAGLARTLVANIHSRSSGEGQGRRRSANEAFASAEREERRVRARIDDGEQVGRNIKEQEGLALLFDQDLEVGRDLGSALSDIPSSVPWNRQLSAGPASSVRGRQVSASPLHERGSTVQGFERFSDGPVVDSDDFELPEPTLPGQNSKRESSKDLNWPHETVDLESQNFLRFLEGIAEKTRVIDGGSLDGGRVWISFTDVVQPPGDTKTIVTQAFFNVLLLATRSIISVDQDHGEDLPFGTIHLGIHL